MSAEDQRNALIVEMVAHSNQPVGDYQGLNDFQLAGAGAVMVFLRGAGIRDDAQLKTISADDQRNIMIVEIDGQTHLGSRLQSLRNMDLVLAGLGVDPQFPVVGPRSYRFSIDSIEVRVHKSDNEHSDSDWLSLVVSIGNAATKDQPRILEPKMFHIGDAIKSGSVIVGPFKTDVFDAEDTDVVLITYVLTNLGSSRVDDQGREAVQITNKVVSFAGPIIGTAVGLFFGQPGEGFKIGQQVAKTFDTAIAALSDVFDFLGDPFRTGKLQRRGAQRHLDIRSRRAGASSRSPGLAAIYRTAGKRSLRQRTRIHGELHRTTLAWQRIDFSGFLA